MSNMNKTSLAFSLRNKELFPKKQMQKIRKYYIKPNIQYSKSAVDIKNKNTNEISKSTKNISPKKNIKILDNEDISKNIFNNLDKIERTLLRKYQYNDNFDGNKFLIINGQSKSEKNRNMFLNNELKEINNRNKKNLMFKNNDEKYDSITIKSRSSINFFKQNLSKTIYLNRNSSLPKRLKSTVERNPKHITRYLERKKINDIPVTFPLFISHNNRYSSMSEKSRIDRILSKLICLKTHIIRDKFNKNDILKEFLLKNGFKDEKYFTRESMNNLYNYLLKPFSFSPEFLLIDVINEGINYKHELQQEEIYEPEDKNFLNYSPKRKNFIELGNKTNKTRNKNQKNNTIYQMMMNDKSNQYLYSDNHSIMNKTLPTLIKDLESELRQIRIEKMAKLDKYNNLLTKKEEMVDAVDKNKFVPNLCLVSKGFKEKYKHNIDKINRKIIKTMNKQEKLKEINNRMYYDIIRKHNLVEFDRIDIQRKSKLTEFVVMEMAKKKYMLENAKNNYVSILKKIKLHKENKENKSN